MRIVELRLVLVFLLTLAASAASAQQARVRVIRDQTIIWNTRSASPATVVKAGTVLDVLARVGRFYQVRLPTPQGEPTGLIAVTEVEVVEGTPPPPRQTGESSRSRSPAPPRFSETGLRGFGTLGFGRFIASRSFDAVLGQPGGLWFGGGVEYRPVPQLFVLGAVDRFTKTGERVFVHNGEVFRLGVPDRISLVPILITLGFRTGGRHAFFAGGGMGRHFFRESSPLGDNADEVKDQFTSYNGVAGYELRGGNGLATAVEVMYTHVPDALSGGASAVFDEHNLGGIQVRLKVLVGRP